MKCPICGAMVDDHAEHCPQCGLNLRPGPLAESEPVSDKETPPPAPGQTEAQRHLERAYGHEDKGELVEALQECEAAVGAAPELAEAHNLRGILLEELGRADEAVEAYRTAVQLEPGFSEARDNLRELMAELTRGQDVVTVTTFVNVLEAQAAQAKLAERGIWSHVVDEFMLIVPPGGARLMAREGDLEEIIKALGLETDDDEGWQCPRCGSWEVRVPFLGRKRRCESCGHRWKVRGSGEDG
jgi:tetratricopeptide (TPR) repeat protein